MHAKVEPSSPHDISERADGPRESTRPIRALNRGLDMLTELNRLERAAINTLATAVGPPAHHHLSDFGDLAFGRLCRARSAR